MSEPSNNFERPNLNQITTPTISGGTEQKDTVSAQPDVVLPEHATGFFRKAWESTLGRVGLIAGGTAATAGLVFGAVELGSAVTPGSEHHAVATAPATPGASETAKPPQGGEVNVKVLPKSVVELGSFETLSPAEKAQIKAWDAMDIDSFREMPLADQRTFAKFVYDNNLGITKYRLDQAGRSSLYQNADTKTPQGIVNQQDLTFAVLSSLKEQHPDGIFVNTLTQHKMLSLLSNDAVATVRLDTQIDTWSVNTQIIDEVETVTNSVTNSDGTFTIATHGETSGVDGNTRFSLQEVKSITGETSIFPITVGVNQ
ncbi:MAG: hypothetical protein JWO99_875 [Candidatus Saccharibacteria bacterium]|nr:hypothetical protein [Candidatus Saccharibacteria bacterium]